MDLQERTNFVSSFFVVLFVLFVFPKKKTTTTSFGEGLFSFLGEVFDTCHHKNDAHLISGNTCIYTYVCVCVFSSVTPTNTYGMNISRV